MALSYDSPRLPPDVTAPDEGTADTPPAHDAHAGDTAVSGYELGTKQDQ